MSGIGKVVRFSDEVPEKKPWQDGLTSSSKALSFLLSTGMLSDITFAVGPDGKQFRVHRLILATRSQVFEEMLVSDPRYCSSEDVIGVREDPVAGFTWLMHHIYCDKTDIDSLELALQILELSEKYMVAGAYDCCLKFLRASVRRNNVLQLYRFLISAEIDNDSLFLMCRKV
ncbi:BTB/POZ domain, partial [Trinorchestia longiramus]